MAQDYKDTLNLPRTDFPMRANLTAREPKRLAHWESIDVYHRALEKNRDGPSFVLHDGPPFTNGHVHIGTALNKILKDTVVRFHLSRGHYAPYIPGWDCHGLPIEAKVTRELQEKGQMLDTPELREACAAFSRSYMETMRPQFARLGVLADWAAEYRTMDPAYEATVLRTFAAFVEQVRKLLCRVRNHLDMFERTGSDHSRHVGLSRKDVNLKRLLFLGLTAQR